jgi:formylglycine-generating enzyme required for sulfatase activity
MKLVVLMAGLAAQTAGCSLLEAWQPASNPSKTKSTTRTAAGAVKVNPKDGLTYVWISPGTFTMGCSPGDSECADDEKPAHQVTITKGFWIGQTEVTQAAYERVTRGNPSHFKGVALPVETNGVEAGAYCKAVGMRLPTEAEWEYAARGGNPAARYGTLDTIAWYDGNSGNRTHEVGQKQANGYGLYDMLGNVWEWVADWYDPNYYASSPASDPKGPSSGQLRTLTLRGGSWFNGSRFARASIRFWVGPGGRYDNFGVRYAGLPPVSRRRTRETSASCALVVRGCRQQTAAKTLERKSLAPQVGLEPTTLRLTAITAGLAYGSGKRASL